MSTIWGYAYKEAFILTLYLQNDSLYKCTQFTPKKSEWETYGFFHSL